MNEVLKPCPFCGGDAEKVNNWNGTCIIVCKGCGVQTYHALVEREAVEAWNKRSEAKS